MKKILTTFSFLILLSVSTFGQVDAEYNELLVEMFEVNGTEETNKAVIKQLVEMFKKHYPNVTSDIWDEFGKEFTETSINELTQMLAPVYYKYLTKADLQELIRFYKTPLGMKYAKNTAPIAEESMQVGQQWGEEIGKEFTKKLQEKGY